MGYFKICSSDKRFMTVFLNDWWMTSLGWRFGGLFEITKNVNNYLLLAAGTIQEKDYSLDQIKWSPKLLKSFGDTRDYYPIKDYYDEYRGKREVGMDKKNIL